MNQLQKQVTVNETGGDVLVDIRHIVDRGTLEAYQGVNTVMVLTYWKVGRRTLDRNIGSQYYNRLLQSPSKEDVMAEMQQETETQDNK